MKILTKLVRKTLILNKKRTLITLIGIILSCSLIGGVATLFSSFQKFFQDLTIETGGNYHLSIDNINLETINNFKGEEFFEEVMIQQNKGFYIGKSDKVDQVFSLVANDKKMFDNFNIKLDEGRLPENSQEIILPYFEKTKYKINDKITLEIFETFEDLEKLSDSIKKEYSIVGFLEENIFSSNVVFTFLEEQKSEEFYSVYIITEDIYKIYEQTEKIYNKYVDNDYASLNYNSDLLRWYGVSQNENATEMIWGVALILIIVIMIASIIVIYNAFNISFVERKKQFGMLSSMGATSKQLRKMIFKEGLFLSIIGIPLGILGSIIGIGITLLVINNLNIFSNFIDTRLVLTVSSLSILITIIFGSLTIFLSCLVPAIKASKTTPIDAIRLSKDYFIKAKSIKTWRINRRILGIEGDIALKNLKRNKKKYRSTILSIFVSICLFITINAFAEYSLRSSLKTFSSLNYDVIIINEDREESEKLVKHRDVKRSSISQTFWV
ncbi:MAG: FtsX-like permease family protein, partial [Bacilli bacterium]